VSIRILQGDCREVLRTLPDNSVDSIVTDPPYGLSFMGKRWDYDVPCVEVWAECLRVLKPGGHLLAFAGTRTQHRMAVRIEDAGFEIRDMIAWVYGSGFPKSHNGAWGGTALKPALEPITMARKPLACTVEANWREHGTGALNIDGCRIEGQKPDTTRGAGGANGRYAPIAAQGRILDDGRGRWPANLIHDGSDEVMAAFPQAPGQQAPESFTAPSSKTRNAYGARGRRPGGFGNVGAASGDSAPNGPMYSDTGSAARFFYCAKADRSDRNAGLEDPGPQFKAGRLPHHAEKVERSGKGNTHPTVKPTDLMRYLCRLVTPAGGVVLDPFMGSGSTLKAAELEGFGAIGIELDPDYIAIARRRIAADAPLFAEVT
jgi:site-specific DNA-methyltransferase (adenine-specific)